MTFFEMIKICTGEDHCAHYKVITQPSMTFLDKCWDLEVRVLQISFLLCCLVYTKSWRDGTEGEMRMQEKGRKISLSLFSFSFGQHFSKSRPSPHSRYSSCFQSLVSIINLRMTLRGPCTSLLLPMVHLILSLEVHLPEDFSTPEYQSHWAALSFLPLQFLKGPGPGRWDSPSNPQNFSGSLLCQHPFFPGSSFFFPCSYVLLTFSVFTFTFPQSITQLLRLTFLIK